MNQNKINYEKAAKICARYVNLSTAIKNCNGNTEMIEIVKKKFERAGVARYVDSKINMKTFCKLLIEKRLKEIARAIPDEGYSMGSIVHVKCGRFSVSDDRTKTYANSCKYRPTYGSVRLIIDPIEFRHIKVIGGLVTYIYLNQRSKVKKCYWYLGEGSKNSWHLKKVDGFIYAGFHSESKESALSGGERNIEFQKQESKKVIDFKKALRLRYSFDDSIKAGNCESGTKAFALRCKLDLNKKYRGQFLLNSANERSTSSVSYVIRMIKSKIKSK